MIHPCGSPVGLNLREGRPQRRLGVELVDQAVPFAAFDPHFEGHQHPCRPNRWFGPRPVAGTPRRPWVLSGAVSRLRHSHRCLSTAFGRHVSTFLHPFAPPALPGFIATTSAVTPAWRRDSETRSAPCGGRYLESFLLLRHAGLLASRVLSLQSLPSPTTPLPPMIAFAPNPSASWASCSHRSGLRLSTAGSPVSVAESSLLSLRTTPSPPVASHPASRRRSYGWLQAGVGLPEEDLHLPEQNALASARSPGQARRPRQLSDSMRSNP